MTRRGRLVDSRRCGDGWMRRPLQLRQQRLLPAPPLGENGSNVKVAVVLGHRTAHGVLEEGEGYRSV